MSVPRETLPSCEARVAEGLANGLTVQQLAERYFLSQLTVRTYIKRAAKRIPGPGSPKTRLIRWFLLTQSHI